MKRLRLQARYTIAIIALIVTIVVILSSVLLYQFQMSTRRMATVSTQSVATELLTQLEKRAATMTVTLGKELRNPLYLYNFEKILSLLETTAEEDEVMSAQVYDENGAIVHDGNRNLRSFGALAQDRELALAAISAGGLVKKRINDELRMAYPVVMQDRVLGGILITFSLDKAEQEARATSRNLSEMSEEGLRQNAYAIGLLTLLLTTFGGALAMVVSARFIRPIKQLAAYSKEIGHGNYEFTMDIERGDEVGELVQALEEMRNNLRESNAEAKYLAYHDRLTGLPNRAMLRTHLDRAIAEAQRNGHSLALFFIDVDNFKRINDTFGHVAGDSVLQTQANRISNCLRAADFVAVGSDKGAVAARLGGDEFIAVVPLNRGPLDAATLARRILNHCEQPIVIDSKEMVVSTSIGIAVYPSDGATSDEMVKHADLAMYQAKAEGKNTYKYFTEELNRRALHNLEIELELRRALTCGELTVYYQPQVDLALDQIVGAEALVRWNHPTRGMIAPNDFIPIAEETGLIVQVGQEVLRQAAKQVAAWRAAGREDFYVSVNVSSVQFRRQDLTKVIQEILEETKAPADALHIELTESNLMKAEDQAQRQLEEIRALGLRVWLDDFGTGYSSLSYLRRIPVDGVKIDRSFISNLADADNDRQLTRTIIGMTESLHLSVIAEGVDSEEQEAILRADGCQYAQGYRYGKPMPPADFERLLPPPRFAAAS